MNIRNFLLLSLVVLLLLSGCESNTPKGDFPIRRPTSTQKATDPDHPSYLPLLLQSGREESPTSPNTPSVETPSTPLPETKAAPQNTLTTIDCVPPNGRDNWVIYTVQSGDTLSSLARRTGTSVTEIQQANCLDGSLILAGQSLYLPSIPVTPSTDTPSPSPEATANPPTDPIPSDTPTSTPTPTETVDVPPAPGPGDPTLTVTPEAAPPGSTFTIIVSEFEPDESTTVVVTFLDTFEVVFTEVTVANSEGNITVYYVSQDDANVGDYLAEAFGEVSFASGEFVISNPP